jgi:hypothetical protein
VVTQSSSLAELRLTAVAMIARSANRTTHRLLRNAATVHTENHVDPYGIGVAPQATTQHAGAMTVVEQSATNTRGPPGTG